MQDSDRQEGVRASALFEYYTRPFALLHLELLKSGYDPRRPHPKRQSYWRVVPPRSYSSIEARPLLTGYLHSLEQDISEVVQQASLVYWTHLWRRLSPGPIGENRDPATTMLVRASLDAAFDKYAQYEPCDRIAVSTDVKMEDILGGMLLSKEMAHERECVAGGEQLVLTAFDLQRLIEAYDLERLVYEVWRTGAMLRVVGKGAPLVVTDDEIAVHDGRSDELDSLVKSFDDRAQRGGTEWASASGIVVPTGEPSPGLVMLPQYHVVRDSPSVELRNYFEKITGGRLLLDVAPNFIWTPFDLRGFYRAHRPLGKAFEAANSVSLESVMCVLASLAFRVPFGWSKLGLQAIWRHWQRAYDVFSYEVLLAEIEAFLPHGGLILGLTDEERAVVDVPSAVRFLSLSDDDRDRIDIAWPGPHSVLRPAGKVWLLDYSWIGRQLHSLFYGVPIVDGSFKGDALESLVRSGGSVLPSGPCKADDGTSKQFDAAFACGNRLVIAECKAINRSIGFHRGDPKAIRYRVDRMNEALNQVDEAAAWLRAHPKGTNYDVSAFESVVPLAVSPFVEFLPSLSTFYWLAEHLPRVLTPAELDHALSESSFDSVVWNLVTVQAIE